MGPWDPNWRPDPTGNRLVAIRAARRGALASAVIFGGLEVLAAMVQHPVDGADLLVGVALALFSLPALALLGAGLTSAALGSRSSAASAGLAIGVGVPVAAVTSAMIGAFVVAGMVGASTGATDGADLAGFLLRSGVTAAVQIAPLIAIASVVWVVLVRRLGRTESHAPSSEGQRRLPWPIRRGRGPRRPDE